MEFEKRKNLLTHNLLISFLLFIEIACTKILQNVFNTFCNIFIFLFFLLFTNFAYAKLTSSVNSSTITNAENLYLTISLENSNESGSINFSKLENDFIIIDTTESQSIISINNRVKRTKVWKLVLEPKRIGDLKIPVFSIGKEKSKEINIKVTDAIKDISNQPLFITSKVDNKTPFIQSQVNYTVSLYSTSKLLNISKIPFAPKVKNAIIQKLNSSKVKKKTYNNKTFWVIDFNYAIFPQQRGKLSIPRIKLPVNFKTNKKTQQINLITNEIILDVKPQIDDAIVINWLPAKDLKIKARYLTEPTIFKVGEPVIREISLQAKSLMASQLPDIKFESSDMFQQYIDDTKTDIKVTEKDLMSTKIQNILIIPNSAGNHILPEIKVNWFNTTTEKLETITLPAQQITVLAANINQPIEIKKSSTKSIIIDRPKDIINQPEIKIIYKEPLKWQILSLILTVFWIITIVILFLVKKNNSKSKKAKINTDIFKNKEVVNEIKKSAKENNIAKCRMALIKWARHNIANNIAGLEEIANNDLFDNIKDDLLELDNILYKNKDKKWNGVVFWEKIKAYLNNQVEHDDSKKDLKLKSLYPQ